VVLLVILSVSASVATRTFHAICYTHLSAQADPSHAKRQHLAADACEMVGPLWQLAGVLLPVGSLHASPTEPDFRDPEFGEARYNRPPPSLSLL
jgi:hypothetical protein